ncbi:MAG: cytochrome-c peroxidase, partial [Polyangiaceae bacterium]
NVALRKAFFHNGVFHHLEQVLQFYATRDSNPSKWYAKTKGQAARYDDLPADAQRNVNQEPPFGRKPGQAPLLSSSEIEDLIAFLNTLTDADLTVNVDNP